MDSSKVSIICLSHNHQDYVSDAIRSVLNQNYHNIELIIVDDGSTDRSKEIIEEVIGNKEIQFIDIKNSIGNCKAFNRGLKVSSGDYIIDLAADDLLLPKRVEQGLQTFHKKTIGVEFCNVMHIDINDDKLGCHFTKKDKVPEGDLYEKLITTYFIPPPGMMIKKTVLVDLGGYDESLSYEDFDFWIRSSRTNEYGYTDQVLVKKRDIPNSLSKKQFQFLSSHQKSTLQVCRKIKALNKYQREDLALRKRCLYELKNCLKQGNLKLIPGFLRLCF